MWIVEDMPLDHPNNQPTGIFQELASLDVFGEHVRVSLVDGALVFDSDAFRHITEIRRGDKVPVSIFDGVPDDRLR